MIMSQTSAHPVAPPRIRRQQTLALSLLVLSGIINYLDRGTLAVANEFVRADLGQVQVARAAEHHAGIVQITPCRRAQRVKARRMDAND